MTTEAKATLKVEVQGDKQIDALNKKLAGIGKDAFKSISTESVNARFGEIRTAATQTNKSLAQIGTGNPLKRASSEIDATTRKVGRLAATMDKLDNGKGGRLARAGASLKDKLASIGAGAKGALTNVGANAKGKIANVGAASVGDRFQRGVTRSTEFAWQNLPFGSGATWGLVDLAAAPISALSKLGGALGGIVGPLGSAAASTATLGASLYAVGKVAWGAISSIIAIKAAFKGLELGAEGARTAVDRRYAAAKQGTSTRAQAAEENTMIRLGIASDADEARTQLDTLREKMRDIVKGDADDETAAAAKRLRLAAKPKKGEEAGATERARAAYDRAPDAKKGETLRDIEKVFGEAWAKAIMTNTPADIAAAKKNALAGLPKDQNEAGALVLKKLLDNIGGEMASFGNRLRTSLITPVSEFYKVLNEKLTGPEGRTIGDALSTMLGDAVRSFTTVIKDIKPEDVTGAMKTIKSAFDSMLGSARTFGESLKMLAEGKVWKSFSHLFGLDRVGGDDDNTNAPENRETLKERLAALDKDKSMYGKLGATFDALGLDEVAKGYLAAYERTKAEIETIKTKLARLDGGKGDKPKDGPDSKPAGDVKSPFGTLSSVAQEAKVTVAGAADTWATKALEARAAIEGAADKLPGRGQEAGSQMGDAVYGKLSPIGPAIGGDIASAIRSGLAGFKLDVNVSGARAALGNVNRTGRDPAAAGAQ